MKYEDVVQELGLCGLNYRKPFTYSKGIPRYR